jgi:hypothetical protein
MKEVERYRYKIRVKVHVASKKFSLFIPVYFTVPGTHVHLYVPNNKINYFIDCLNCFLFLLFKILKYQNHLSVQSSMFLLALFLFGRNFWIGSYNTQQSFLLFHQQRH